MYFLTELFVHKMRTTFKHTLTEIIGKKTAATKLFQNIFGEVQNYIN